jgi:pyrroloquinoline quinone (PQQ) biosynthesis protein C
MKRSEWRKALGELVRDAMRSAELDHYFKVKITQPGARVLITQLGLFIHHRRDCWAHVSGNCPHMSVKQKILQHEYGEVIKDNYTEHGHMELIVRQGKSLGLTAEEVMNVAPLPSTMATLYAWAWMTREKSWLEGLASLTITEWANDDRLLRDVGRAVEPNGKTLDGGSRLRVGANAELQSSQRSGRRAQRHVFGGPGKVRHR